MAEESTYTNPVDGTAYRANWKEYTPDKPSEEPAGPVALKGARLLTEQAIFDRNLTATELAGFIKATQASVVSSVGQPTATFAILVDTTITKDSRPEFRMASQGTVSDATLQKIIDGFKGLPDLRSKSDTLKYQVHFEITK